MKTIPIYNGQNIITLDDKLVNIYETVRGKIDTTCCEYMLATDKITSNTTLSNEDLSNHVTIALNEELKMLHQVFCEGGYDKIIEDYLKSQTK